MYHIVLRKSSNKCVRRKWLKYLSNKVRGNYKILLNLLTLDSRDFFSLASLRANSFKRLEFVLVDIFSDFCIFSTKSM